jgi:hypothetical protein
MSQESWNSILFYKGLPLKFIDTSLLILFIASNIEDTSEFNFGVDDFVLILQTKTMWELVNRFGNRLLAIDATHNTTCFGFKLITVSVVEPNSNYGFPVLFAITSGESGPYLNAVFVSMKVTNFVNQPTINVSELQNKSPDLLPKVLLSDDDNVSWSAARSHFPSITQHFLCVWHVDKNWKRQVGAANPSLNVVFGKY